jgi:hypothetical protein
MLTATSLQSFLNQFEVLRGIEVTYESDIKQALAPQIVLLTGMVNVKGTPHLFETEINLNEFHSREDLMLLGKSMLKAFEKAGVEQLGN